MNYRTLGKTGLKVSVVGYGGSSLGAVFHSICESEAIRSVHIAIDHGINFIDTAPTYGATTAETVLGKALQEIPRDQYLLATKVGRYGSNAEVSDFSATHVLQGLDESLARLKVEYVDVIQVHDVECRHLPIIIKETIPALRCAQAAGKARFVGITGLALPPLLRVARATEIDLIHSNGHYCLNDDTLGEILPELQKMDLGIINSAPRAMRLLTNEGPPTWHPAPELVRAKCAEAADYCRRRGINFGKLALQFSVREPAIHCNIIGTANPRRVVENILDASRPANRELLAAVLEILRPIHNLSWQGEQPEHKA